MCPRECVRARCPFGMCRSRYPRVSCLPTIGAGVGSAVDGVAVDGSAVDGRVAVDGSAVDGVTVDGSAVDGVVSAQQTTSTWSMSKVGPLPERHSIGHETTHSRNAHSPSVYLETLYRSIEAVFHPSVRVTLALASRTIERARVHPYTHGNADTWAHALIRSCIMCARA